VPEYGILVIGTAKDSIQNIPVYNIIRLHHDYSQITNTAGVIHAFSTL